MKKRIENSLEERRRLPGPQPPQLVAQHPLVAAFASSDGREPLAQLGDAGARGLELGRPERRDPRLLLLERGSSRRGLGFCLPVRLGP